MPPDLTFVVPFRNEAQHLCKTIESLARQDLGPFCAEVLLFDGMSEDLSREIAEREAAARSSARLQLLVVENPRRRTQFAFNRGIELARAPIVGFGGAHTDYPPHYFKTALELLGTLEVDVVGGGHDRFLPGGRGPLARAMACLYRSPMGSAVAAYHRRTTAGLVDTVYGGFYRKGVFEHVGCFDERLARNQDNELNSRVTSAGHRIYFDPSLSTSYVQKSDLRTFFRRGLDFGLHHPETWARSWRAFRVRHAIPALFVAYLVALALPALHGLCPLVLALPLGLYGLLLLAAAFRLAAQEGLVVGLLTIPLFFGYHLAYGIGTWAGVGSVLLRAALGRHDRVTAESSQDSARA
jgi:succinoglycan biosynthesis protein ExoA